jgi:hypothetical protein
MAGRRLRQIEAAGRCSRRTKPRGGPGFGLRTMMFPAADASLRYDATPRPDNPYGRSAPLRRKHLRGCPRGARSKPLRGPALRSGWLSAPLAFIGGRRSPLQTRHRLRGRAQGACHARRLRTLASGSRCNPSVLGEGVAPEKWWAMGAQQKQQMPCRRSGSGRKHK